MIEENNKGQKAQAGIIIAVVAVVIIGALALLFMLPIITSAATKAPEANQQTEYALSDSSSASARLKVDIPCPGHAQLIISQLKSVKGVSSVRYSPPNIFEVSYDPAETSKEQIISLEVFKTYKATYFG